jgi:ABC-type multidrug transport system fused ATPase/permease subunit
VLMLDQVTPQISLCVDSTALVEKKAVCATRPARVHL